MSPPAGRRILVLNTWESLYPMIGGGGTPIEGDMFDAFLDAGYEIDMIAPPSDAPSDFPDRPGFRIHRLGPARIERDGMTSRRLALAEFTARLVGRALRISRGGPRPAVIYGLGTYATPAAARVGRILRRPSIGVIFGTYLHPMLGDRKAMRGQFEELHAFRAPVTRLSVLDDGTRGDRVAEAVGVPPERVVYRMHGVDRAACEAAAKSPLDPESLGIPADAPLIVSASRLAGWKRVDRVLRAMPAVLESHPGAVLAIAGDGPSAPELRELAAELGIEDSVVFIGALPRDGTLRLMAASDVFCAFYDYSNVGVVLLEALSCGAAVVVADTGATTELIRDGENGLVVPPDDEAAAAAAIVRLLDDPGLRSRLSEEAARGAAAELMSVEERMALELELVCELAAR